MTMARAQMHAHKRTPQKLGKICEGTNGVHLVVIIECIVALVLICTLLYPLVTLYHLTRTQVCHTTI